MSAVICRSLDFDKLDLCNRLYVSKCFRKRNNQLTKGELSIGRDVWGSTTLPVGLGSWDGEDAFSTNKHAWDSLVPALDYITSTKGKEERFPCPSLTV